MSICALLIGVATACTHSSFFLSFVVVNIASLIGKHHAGLWRIAAEASLVCSFILSYVDSWDQLGQWIFISTKRWPCGTSDIFSINNFCIAIRNWIIFSCVATIWRKFTKLAPPTIIKKGRLSRCTAAQPKLDQAYCITWLIHIIQVDG